MYEACIVQKPTKLKGIILKNQVWNLDIKISFKICKFGRAVKIKKSMNLYFSNVFEFMQSNKI